MIIPETVAFSKSLSNSFMIKHTTMNRGTRNDVLWIVFHIKHVVAENTIVSESLRHGRSCMFDFLWIQVKDRLIQFSNSRLLFILNFAIQTVIILLLEANI